MRQGGIKGDKTLVSPEGHLAVFMLPLFSPFELRSSKAHVVFYFLPC
jgi:hypothetical protein